MRDSHPQRPGLVRAAAALAMLGPALAVLAAQQASPPAPARAHKSVRGTLNSVDPRLNVVSMKTEDGRPVAWRFKPAVIAEAAKYKAGVPVIVIYRLMDGDDKRVTAIAFPDPAARPTYVNLTGDRVVLRTAPATAGECTSVDPDAIQETMVPNQGRAEALEGCWCCAPAGTGCIPATKSGAGWAFLDRCFE